AIEEAINILEYDMQDDQRCNWWNSHGEEELAAWPPDLIERLESFPRVHQRGDSGAHWNRRAYVHGACERRAGATSAEDDVKGDRAGDYPFRQRPRAGGAVTRIPERQWVKRPDEWPPPEVECRPATPEQIPQGAKRIMTLATSHGWRVHVMYSRGTVGLHRRRMADVVTVRAARDGVRWWAAWIEGKFAHAQ